jgi:hypothetical protein
MIYMPLKWHHIDKCSKNCKKIDVLTSILAHLNSSACMIILLRLLNYFIENDVLHTCCEDNISMDDDFVHALVHRILRKVTSLHIRCSPPNLRAHEWIKVISICMIVRLHHR